MRYRKMQVLKREVGIPALTSAQAINSMQSTALPMSATEWRSLQADQMKSIVRNRP